MSSQVYPTYPVPPHAIPDRVALHHQRGIGLIEVLVSLLILSIGILGTMNLQTRSVQFNQGALFESRATMLAGDIIDRMRANASKASQYRIDLNDAIPSYKVCSGPSANCDESDLADYDVAKWRENVASVLPEGRGQVEEIAGIVGNSVFVITIQYSDSRTEDASAYGQSNAAPPKQFVFRTSI